MSTRNQPVSSQLGIPRVGASRFCKDLLNTDDTIVCAVISDDQGNVIGLDWKRGRVPWENGDTNVDKQFSNIIEEKLGTWMQIILSLASQTAPVIGTFERASFIHRDFQLVMLGPSLDNKVIGIMISRSANTEHVVSKVREIFG